MTDQKIIVRVSSHGWSREELERWRPFIEDEYCAYCFNDTSYGDSPCLRVNLFEGRVPFRGILDGENIDGFVCRFCMKSLNEKASEAEEDALDDDEETLLNKLCDVAQSGLSREETKKTFRRILDMRENNDL